MKLKEIKGLGEKTCALMEKIDIKTVAQLVHHFPRLLEDRRFLVPINQLVDGETACIKAKVLRKPTLTISRRGLSMYQVVLSDGMGTITAVFYNSPYVVNVFCEGLEFCFYGKIVRGFNGLQIQNPIFERAGTGRATERIVPVYPSTKGLSQKLISSSIEKCLQVYKEPQLLPQEMLDKYGIMEINQALRDIHFPKSAGDYSKARDTLAFMELFQFQLGLKLMKWKKTQEISPTFASFDYEPFVRSLPFELTEAQKRVACQLVEDLKAKSPMNRLLLGDVGSGKTAVAALLLYVTAVNNMQAVLMAPTEILAGQHFKTISQMLGGFGISVGLLTGTVKKKDDLKNAVASGEIDVVITTHAILYGSIKFKSLGLIITDEQHRFGVNSRAKLALLNPGVNTLFMTATPIPRSLALTMYGDTDISVIDMLPPGRKPVHTYAVDDSYRRRVYDFVLKHVKEGKQAYVVCPVIEESQNMTSVIEFSQSLKEGQLRDVEVLVCHGRQKPKEKEEVMSMFLQGLGDVLVSTTVIEVGVDVPNACIMVIENAERFGLSALHQLRGRVGRGAEQSYCIMFNNSKSQLAKERMDIMQKTNDGFQIAEKDLELRGPGEFFGLKQHGLPQFKIADLQGDIKLLHKTTQLCQEILENREQYLPLIEKVVNKMNELVFF